MWNKKLDPAPLMAWLFGAMSAPAAQLAGQVSWMAAIAMAVLCWGLCFLTWRMEFAVGSSWLRWAEVAVLALVSGSFCRMAANSWPSGGYSRVVASTLLVLAAVSAWNGAERASRAGGVVFWFLALLYGLVVGAGIQDWKAAAAPDFYIKDGMLIVALLLPAAGALLPREKGSGSAFGLLFAFAPLAALWVAGVLPGWQGQDSFYEAGKSLRLLGVAERFESFISVAYTMGYFSLLSLLLSCAGSMAGRWGIGLTAAAAGGMLWGNWGISPWLLVILCTCLWALVPWAVGIAGKGKRSKKSEKKA